MDIIYHQKNQYIIIYLIVSIQAETAPPTTARIITTDKSGKT